MRSGCGAVGRAVTYDTRGPGFDSSHRQLLLNIYLLLTVCRKDENKEKRPGMAHLLKKKKKKLGFKARKEQKSYQKTITMHAVTMTPVYSHDFHKTVHPP